MCAFYDDKRLCLFMPFLYCNEYEIMGSKVGWKESVE
jgi:hypothetical protein